MVIITIVTVAMIGVMVPSVFALTIIPDDGKPEGHIPVLDDKILIVQHNGIDLLAESSTNNSPWLLSNSIIFGEIVNAYDKNLYYPVIRANVYSNGELLDESKYPQSFTFRYNNAGAYDQELQSKDLAVSPHNLGLKPGESTQFVLWPGQVNWDCYEIWIESYELENKFKKISNELLDNDLELMSINDNRGIVSGKIYNPTENIFDHSYVVISKYNQNGKLFAVLGDDTGSIGPGKNKNFQISLYLEDHLIKTDTDYFMFEKPTNYKISVWGYDEWRNFEEMGLEEARHPIKSAGSDIFFPNNDDVYNIDAEKIIKHKDNRTVSSCLADSNQNFKKGIEKQIIPSWIKNNAGWWANGTIDEEEFLSTLDYLLKHEMLRIDIPRIDLHMELDSQTYYVTKYNDAKIILSGWYKHNVQMPIQCDLWEPDEVFASKFSILREGAGWSGYYQNQEIFTGNFELPISLSLDYAEGTYDLECWERSTYLTTLSFEIIHGESPEVEEIIQSKIPSWIKNNAGWWADGTIDDSTFLTGLEYLVQNGIIDAGRYNSKILEN